MTASLLLLLPLLPFTCQGMEQDNSIPSGILPTTKWQKMVETPLEVSCPDPADIDPCVCDIYTPEYLYMVCSNVQDEEQLRNVFLAFFPTTAFYRFDMRDNTGVKVLEDGVFGNVSFQVFTIYDSVLETVVIDALTPSLSTLTQIVIRYCVVEIFPFERLTEFTSLQFLDLSFNKIHTLPPLSSSSLQYLYLSSNLITHLTPDVFKLLPAVEVLFLFGNQLTEISKGTFTDIPKLGHLVLHNNNISYLQSHTIELVSSPFYITILDLDNNNIEYVAVDAFKDVVQSAEISMKNNALTRLPEEVWRPVLEKSITIYLAGNDLACGCDVAWLVRELQLLTMTRDARCTDGTLLMDLNPADFDICG